MSNIEWTDETWNPTTGCDRVSPGCDNCYALTMSARLKAMGQAKYQTDGRPATSGPGFGVQTHPDTLDEPLKWRKPRRVVANSMSDLFHPQVPDEFIESVFDVMLQADQHVFQVLTKRPERMAAWVTRFLAPALTPAVLSHIWLGVSVEDQERAERRIPYLLATPAVVRFLSCEPLLGPVDLSYTLDPEGFERDTWLNYLDWVIIGGESGPGARPMDLAWARAIVEQCRQAGVACFVKQLGSAPSMHVAAAQAVRRKGGDPTKWPADLRVREFPEAAPS